MTGRPRHAATRPSRPAGGRASVSNGRARDVAAGPRACVAMAIGFVVLGLALACAAASLPRARAPQFRTRTVTGDVVDLGERLRHGPVLLDFWATWCRPCLESIPGIEALHERHAARGLGVLGISIDGPRNFSKVRPFAARLGVRYPIVLDEDSRLQELFQVRTVPTAILIDTSGAIAFVAQGFRPGETAALDTAIARVLGTAAPETTARHP